MEHADVERQTHAAEPMNLISCIMPARGRSLMAQRALRSFLVQNYEHKELIIVDDLHEPAFAMRPDFSGVTYIRDESRSIALKRNHCCALATGDLIAHWDSDDWSAETRLSAQFKMLQLSQRSVAGFCSMLFADETNNDFRKYEHSPDYYALGTSLVYRREFWQANPFKERIRPWGEDNVFVDTARDLHQLVSRDAEQLMVVGIHSDNTSQKRMELLTAVSRDQIPQEFFI
jgi:glycosyltransferase involved in cell wall biosynthesis